MKYIFLFRILSRGSRPWLLTVAPLGLAPNMAIYRIRSGDYRIIYEIRDKSLLVLVVRIGKRGDVYRHLP